MIPHHPQPRAGFTLLELCVTLVLFSAGALALAGTSTVIATRMARAQWQIRTSTLAQARIEQVTSLRCDLRAGGSTISGPLTETWTSSSTGSFNSAINHSISQVAAGKNRSTAAVIPCIQ